MRYIIDTADNGFILIYPAQNGGEKEMRVYEGEDEEAFSNMVEELSHALVKPHDRFGCENINISWDKKGRKADDSDLEL